MRDLGGICRFCKHWRPGIDHPQGTQTCAAFPTGIPDPIYSGAELHMESVRGDNGVVFTPDEDVTPEMVQDFLGFRSGSFGKEPEQ